MKCHFKIGDRVRVVNLHNPLNRHLNGREGVISNIITEEDEVRAVFPDSKAYKRCEDPCVIIDGVPRGMVVLHQRLGYRSGLGFDPAFLRLIHPPATKSFGEIIQGLKKGTRAYD